MKYTAHPNKMDGRSVTSINWREDWGKSKNHIIMTSVYLHVQLHAPLKARDLSSIKCAEVRFDGRSRARHFCISWGISTARNLEDVKVEGLSRPWHIDGVWCRVYGACQLMSCWFRTHSECFSITYLVFLRRSWSGPAPGCHLRFYEQSEEKRGEEREWRCGLTHPGREEWARASCARQRSGCVLGPGSNQPSAASLTRFAQRGLRNSPQLSTLGPNGKKKPQQNTSVQSCWGTHFLPLGRH